MKKFYTLKKLIFITLLLSIPFSQVSAKEKLRLAILDNFHYQKYVTTNYKEYYMKGINLEIKENLSEEYDIEVKIFQYGNDPLSILEESKKMLAWNPDVIIGPRDSNKFLLLSNKIKNILTISPFATSVDIEKMPGNFFSLTPSDKYSAKAMSDYIKVKYPKKGVYIITEADCKSCTDLSKEFKKYFSEDTQVPNEQYYLGNEISKDFTKNILNKYKTGEVILLSGTAHSSATLMPLISNQLNENVIFIGGDGWGSWLDTEVGKILSGLNYTALHIVPWSLSDCSNDFLNFKKKYFKAYGRYPVDILSFLSYRTLKSVIDSYKENKRNIKGDIKKKLLLSYKLSLENDKNYFKSTKYFIFKIRNAKNKFIGTIDRKNITKNKKSKIEKEIACGEKK